MYEQYAKLVVDSRRARRRLAETFESRVDWETECRPSLLNDRILATAPEKNAGKGEASIRDIVRSIANLAYRIWSRTSVKQPGSAKRDISGFGFLFVLAHLSEIAAVQADNPVFWLLVGPTPLVPL